MSYAFDADTRVEPLADGVLGATITDRWNALGERPNGGYHLGICLQALRRVLPFPDPLTVAAFFLRPARPGPAEVRTEVVRAGRRLATGEARLLQEGARRSFAPPDLPPPDETVDVLGGQSIPGLGLVDRFEYRMAGRPGWAQGRPSGDPRVQLWLRFRDGRDADPLSLPAIVDRISGRDGDRRAGIVDTRAHRARARTTGFGVLGLAARSSRSPGSSRPCRLRRDQEPPATRQTAPSAGASWPRPGPWSDGHESRPSPS